MRDDRPAMVSADAQTETPILDKTDERGQLRMAGLHDAQLTDFAYASRTALRFSLLGQNREVTDLTVARPHVLNIIGLWEGSIVDAVFAWKVDAVPEQVWSDPESGWNALLDQRVDLGDRRREAERLAVRHPTAVLMIVSCSYGGRWAVLGDAVTIAQVQS